MVVLPMWRIGPKSTNAAVSEGRIRSIGGIFASSTEAPAPRFAGGQPARINIKIYNNTYAYFGDVCAGQGIRPKIQQDCYLKVAVWLDFGNMTTTPALRDQERPGTPAAASRRPRSGPETRYQPSKKLGGL